MGGIAGLFTVLVWLLKSYIAALTNSNADVKAQRDRALDLVFRMANNIQALADPDAKGKGKS